MLLIAACGEKQKRPRKTSTRYYEREREAYNLRYRNDPEFRAYRCKIARDFYHRRKEKMKEASQ